MSGTSTTNFPNIASDAGNSRTKARQVLWNKTYKNSHDFPGDSD
jgi:hypothetical protein